MTSALSETFIKPTRIPSLFQKPGLSVFASEFNSAAYSPSLHADFNIPLPFELKDAAVCRKAEYLAGRYSARSALATLGIATDFILHRKPNRSPDWPEGMTGSISHSQGKCFAVTTQKGLIQSLGIDAENLVLRKSQIDRIENAISLQRERSLIDELQMKADRTVLVGTLFTLKESIYKAIQPLTGERFDLQDIEITKLNWDEGQADWQARTLSGQASFEWDGEWVHALALVHSGLT